MKTGLSREWGGAPRDQVSGSKRSRQRTRDFTLMWVHDKQRNKHPTLVGPKMSSAEALGLDLVLLRAGPETFRTPRPPRGKDPRGEIPTIPEGLEVPLVSTHDSGGRPTPPPRWVRDTSPDVRQRRRVEGRTRVHRCQVPVRSTHRPQGRRDDGPSRRDTAGTVAPLPRQYRESRTSGTGSPMGVVPSEVRDFCGEREVPSDTVETFAGAGGG